MLNLGNAYLTVGDVSCEVTSAALSPAGLELLGSCFRGEDDLSDGSLVLERSKGDGLHAEFRGEWTLLSIPKAEFFRCVPAGR